MRLAKSAKAGFRRQEEEQVLSTGETSAGSILRGRLLAAARLAWLALTALVLLLFSTGTPAYSVYLHNLSTAEGGRQTEQLSAAGLRTLHSLGLSLDFYAAYRIVVSTGYLIGFMTVAAILFLRKPQNP